MTAMDATTEDTPEKRTRLNHERAAVIYDDDCGS
jgi:hypothetical protein